ncbi:MAG: HAD-IIB family hydrolase [Spirochaetia bacterium]|jgi:HAD superfamily hydrolase (TIGR01484 family)
MSGAARPDASGSARPAPLSALPPKLCRDLSILFSDIDDTLTTNGMLPESSYGALWDLARAGIRVVPVTGRPAGWCDHIARMWPVAGVVGENGAFYYAYDRERRTMARRQIPAEPGWESSGREKLKRAAARVLREVPGTAMAADQAFRVSDFAIDYCEDVPPLSPQSVDEICRILSEEGVHFKVSSIHVNFWLGSFDKLSGVRLFLSGEAVGTLEDLAEQTLFIGDSPNDEPLFAGFAHSIAVGNLRRFLPRLIHRPEFLTERDSAEGFREAADAILSQRARPQ